MIGCVWVCIKVCYWLTDCHLSFDWLCVGLYQGLLLAHRLSPVLRLAVCVCIKVCYWLTARCVCCAPSVTCRLIGRQNHFICSPRGPSVSCTQTPSQLIASRHHPHPRLLCLRTSIQLHAVRSCLIFYPLHAMLIRSSRLIEH